jgi:protein-L-isoaspartate(D-aspartate) O-methyltransferase
VEEDELLRAQMVDGLGERGALTDVRVEQALRAVPRHRFLPGVALAEAYADHAVVVKRAGGGTPLSSASQPAMVAAMLEALQVGPGHRVLEVGAGTGYNAALLAALVVPGGEVVTVELEADLADRAAAALAETGVERVQVVRGDGAEGYPPGAPYDRVIVTAGAAAVSTAWPEQLVDGGRLVVPVVGADGVGSVLVLDKVGPELVRRSEIPCGFLPMRARPQG